MSQEKRYTALKYQGLLREYGPFLEDIIRELHKEYDQRIDAETAEKVGLEYAKRQASKDALTGLMKRLNTRASQQ